MPPYEYDNMADSAGSAAEEAYTSVLNSGGSPAEALGAATEAAGNVMTDMGADSGMVDTMVTSATEGFTSAMEANPGMDPMDAFDIAGSSVDSAFEAEYGPMDGPPTGMESPSNIADMASTDMPSPGMEGDMAGPTDMPPPGMEGDMAGPADMPSPGMEGDMAGPTDMPPPGMEGDMAGPADMPPPGMEGDMAGPADMPPPGMEGDMPPTDPMMSASGPDDGNFDSGSAPIDLPPGMDEASSYMDQSSAEAMPEPSYDPASVDQPDVSPDDVAIPDPSTDDDASGMA